MNQQEKIEYAKERHALAVAARDFDEAAKWQQHLIELGGDYYVGLINHTNSGMWARLAERLANR